MFFISRQIIRFVFLILFVVVFFVSPAYCQNSTQPKNIILMIGDGMGRFHIDLASAYRFGELNKQIYHSFPVQINMSTYAYNQQYDAKKENDDFWYVKSSYTDSAAAGTAMSTGVKTNNGVLGLDHELKRLVHATEVAFQSGRSTGVVTNVMLSHATPASFVAHQDPRTKYRQIAHEMIKQSTLSVLIGTGHPLFDNSHRISKKTKNNLYKYVGGKRMWNEIIQNQILGVDIDGDGKKDSWTFLETKSQFENLAKSSDPPQRVLGIPQVHSTLQYRRIRTRKEEKPFDTKFNNNLPDLSLLSKSAINVLEQNSKGFFLMIEGGAIDWAAHDNHVTRLVEEQIDFDKAVETVVQWIVTESSWEDTLLIITSDHETGYLVGPGSGQVGDRSVIKELVLQGRSKLPDHEWNSRQHTNALVPVFAKGPGSEKLLDVVVEDPDSRWGGYIDNTDIGKLLKELLQ